MRRTKEELIEEFKVIAGENVTSDESIAFLENLADSIEVEEPSEDDVDWKAKYDELDMEWRKKYIERFSEGAESEEAPEDDQEEPTPEEEEEERAETIGYDDLFEEKKEEKKEEEE